MIGLYGPILFATNTPFEGMKKSVAARWGVHEVWKSKPLLEYAGPQLIELEFKMSFIVPFTANPRAMITVLEETMNLALPYPLVIGLKPMGRGASLFVMTDLSYELQYFFRGGAIMGATAEVKLKEYPDTLLSSLLSALGGAFGGSGGTAAGAATVKVGTIAPDVSAGNIPTALTGAEADAIAAAKAAPQTSVAIASRT